MLVREPEFFASGFGVRDGGFWSLMIIRTKKSSSKKEKIKKEQKKKGKHAKKKTHQLKKHH